MEKIYDPHSIEQLLYKNWEQQGYFKPHGNESKESFCIMIPPPNITGSLHMGHAFQYTIIDIMFRYQRMLGKNSLLQFGVDHAGIATQIIVERNIAAKEGKTKHDYGRDAFIDKIWQWKTVSVNLIKNQMRRLGSSIDWERERFTMDKGISDAVREIFVRLYKENLIYRGKCLVNWDPKLGTAISDLEVENRKSKGYIWYIRYPLADGIKTEDGKNYLVIATTRPETIFGDVGIAVNREDIRYRNLIGKFVILPLVNRRIPILSDEYANIKKGTGCVKITPAHDFNDYKVGIRHQLPMINILTSDGKIRENAEIFSTEGDKLEDYFPNLIPIKFQNLERFAARKAVISDVNSLGLLEEINSYDLIIPYSDRSGVIIEPMLTDQWYVRIKSLVNPAVEAVKNGIIQFVSKQYENMYFSWMNNIQDWCISRQLWWGHRIPAWYDDKNNIYVGRDEEEVRKENNLSIDICLRQDDDVLDTWFSSSLWTFSTLGWPENTNALRQFHPTSVIVSGFDIIFFWIARMIMMTMHFIKDENGKSQIPFKVVYITGLIRDDEGKKMSKSRGNVIDPLDMIDGISLAELIKKRTDNVINSHLVEKISMRTKKQFPNGIKPHGADALRFTLAALTTTSRDINWDMKRLEGYRNFCNKLWNASLFVLKNTKNQDCSINNHEKILSTIDRWIITKFNLTVKTYCEALDNFRFDIAANILYEFIWNQFCDWYLEFAKSIINYGCEVELRSTRYTLVTILEAILRLGHPIIPFITETIWQTLKVILNIKSDTIMLQPFPRFENNLIYETAYADTEWLKKVITTIRNIRAEMNIIPNKPLKLLIRNYSKEVIPRVEESKILLKTIAHLEDVTLLSINDKCPASIIKIVDGIELLIPMANTIDKTLELKRLAKEIIRIEEKIGQIKAKLANENFVNNAPKIVINKEYKRLTVYNKTRIKLIEQQKIVSYL